MDGSLKRQMEEFYREQPRHRHPIAWKPDTASVNRLLRRTAGNALLVGLALYRVHRHPNQPEVPRKALLDERVEQIVDALRVAGIGPEGILAIATATLAGPDAATPLSALTRETRFDPDKMDVVPNLHHLAAPAAPLVQPEPIGDAFVRYILAEKRCAPDRRQQLITAAWQAAANGQATAVMLRTARRLSVGEDALARALREGPPPEAGLDELSVALAHAQWALQIPRADWDLGDVPGPAPFPALPAATSKRCPIPRKWNATRTCGAMLARRFVSHWGICKGWRLVLQLRGWCSSFRFWKWGTRPRLSGEKWPAYASWP
jgi:hypothetical protein